MSMKTQANSRQDATVWRLFMHNAGPAVLSVLVAALYSSVDKYFLGNYVGTAALGAASVAFPLLAFGNGLFVLATEGTSGMSGRALGEGRVKRAQACFDTACVLQWICALFWWIALLGFTRPLLRLCGAGPQLMEPAVYYTRVTGSGMGLYLAFGALAGQMRACGRTKAAMMSTLIGVALNIPLDWLLMVKIPMGLAGAAWATFLGQALSALYTVVYVTRGKTPFRFRRPEVSFPLLGRALALGFSPWLVSMSFTLVMLGFNFWVARLGGELALAAIGVFFAVDSLCYLPMNGVRNGMMPAASWCYGARQWGMVRRVTLVTFWVMFGWFVLETLVSFCFARAMASPFVTGDGPLLSLSARAIALGHAGHVGCAATLAANMVLQACGRARAGIVLSVARELCYLPALLIFPRLWGLDGVWLAFPFVDLAGGVFAFFGVAGLWRSLKKASDRSIAV